jgi:hypothetical protein
VRDLIVRNKAHTTFEFDDDDFERLSWAKSVLTNAGLSVVALAPRGCLLLIVENFFSQLFSRQKSLLPLLPTPVVSIDGAGSL